MYELREYFKYSISFGGIWFQIYVMKLVFKNSFLKKVRYFLKKTSMTGSLV